jgi:thiol-disulfide isomerase/thioredoxin
MKIRSILFATLSVAVFASCGGKVSDVTEITGTVDLNGISEIHLAVGNEIDTIAPITDGKFAINLPADITVYGRIYAGEHAASFISDGTPLNVTFSDKLVVTSAAPKVSVHEKYVSFNAEDEAFMKEYMAKQKEIYADTLLTQEEKSAEFEKYFDGFIAKYVDYNKESVKANPDNFISVLALSNLMGQLEDDEMSSLCNLLTPEMQQNRNVNKMKEAIDARINTAEGKPFIDFTVSSVVGMTRSIPPQPKYADVKFSDYVGKGKYILVDFWAPWCGPCKREIPNLKAVYDKYAGENFDILSIAVWERQPVQVTIDTAAELGMNWSHINNAGSVPTDIYGVEGIPHLMLIGPDGTILKRGFHGAEGINAAVEEYLK